MNPDFQLLWRSIRHGAHIWVREWARMKWECLLGSGHRLGPCPRVPHSLLFRYPNTTLVIGRSSLAPNSLWVWDPLVYTWVPASVMRKWESRHGGGVGVAWQLELFFFLKNGFFFIDSDAMVRLFIITESWKNIKRRVISQKVMHPFCQMGNVLVKPGKWSVFVPCKPGLKYFITRLNAQLTYCRKVYCMENRGP